MPELPEVQAIRNQLEKFVVGHEVMDVEVKNKKVAPDDFTPIVGAKFKSIRRFGKVLVFDFDNGYSTVTHIKLTGQFIYRGPKLVKHPALSKKVSGGVPGGHTHVIFKLDNKGFLYYNDIRRFGWIKLTKTKDVEEFGFIKKLGPEPFGKLDLKTFKEILGKTKRQVKVVLMDQSKMGGVGNIYANDALWDAKVHPGRAANSLSLSEQTQLFKSIEKVLKKGIEAGGASELAFVTPDGGEGSYQKYFLAYGKQGALCTRCKKDRFKKIALGGRGTYYCPHCQKI
ncbi:DNA-formamidopyrimidine glycosylase [Candidatus Woesebacteria bacterium RIFCSPHIGHO2_01_FULL_44_21]|uniref:DNA-formamidopyrimidine glycosylase n=1 Tax=Candidatus Woesebacteria bacterium RIFCSPHIGHO2_01_FULL_44_21 TaxID=1802503 RepID=A0A1F7YYV6_9BACT|nr:MAG: DNA-formamidopyrimidine glycosylase [Candidatus Woesebacteria bacterium RIFCSPHIGHO2_01_FULL_44_21]OGM69149.1 MAG: DNA-formamidopyrimidine glycosylase [Candidatus Woesebacteria bacterium RIFCSPLOWO2_01_FULL_44_24b]